MGKHENIAQAEITLIAIPPEKGRDLWSAVAPLLDKAYEASDMIMPDDIPDMLASRKMVLWVVCEGSAIIAAMTTEIYPTRSGLALRLVYCAGERFVVWKHLFADIEKYARKEGCEKITLEGRPAWLRMLDGFTSERVLLEKRISPDG